MTTRKADWSAEAADRVRVRGLYAQSFADREPDRKPNGFRDAHYKREHADWMLLKKWGLG